jgi:hypothetical protein
MEREGFDGHRPESGTIVSKGCLHGTGAGRWRTDGNAEAHLSLHVLLIAGSDGRMALSVGGALVRTVADLFRRDATQSKSA